jgi:hypothetical protein
MGQDPMEIRWAVQFGVRHKPLEGWRAGTVQPEFGVFFPVRRFQTVQEIHSTDDNPNFPREQIVVKSADSVEQYLNECLGGRDGSGNPDSTVPNFGVKFGFRGENDVAKVAVISATLMPSLSAIRKIAEGLKVPSPIPAKCPSEDGLDFDGRESCPTCWLDWVQSSACHEHITRIASLGMDVEEFDSLTNEVDVRLIRPTLEELEHGRSLAEAALKEGVATNRNIWQTLLSELEKNERKGLDQYQHNIRKDVHGTKPADKQLELMREYGAASKQPASSGNNDELMQMMVESNLRMEQLIGAVLGNRSTAPFAVPADPEPKKVAAPVKEAPTPKTTTGGK